MGRDWAQKEWKVMGQWMNASNGGKGKNWFSIPTHTAYIIYNHIYETYIIYIYKYIDVYIIHIPYLGSGFKYFLFSPLLGEMIQID